MNEALLNALIKLYALIADIKHFKKPDFAIRVLDNYFTQSYGKQLADKYIVYFKEHLQKYHVNIPQNQPINIKVYKDRVSEICSAIYKELEQKQKLWLTLQLIEFISDSDYDSHTEIELVREISRNFNIDNDDFEHSKTFILNDHDSIPLTEKILVIDSNKDFKHDLAKHLYKETINGKIYVLQIKSSDTYLFKYFGERNLLLNGLNIKANRAYIWAVGAVIRGRRMNPIYFSKMINSFVTQENNSKIEFVATDISYRFKNSKNGIKPFDFKAESGQLIGIVGGSGSGKSTFLNVLNGNLKPRTGEILINGYNLHDDDKLIEGIIGYVPQEDLLFEELTVYENLYYNAKLCFKNYTHEQIHQIINNTIDNFDLKEAKDLKVGDPINKILSGGQRKRLNIALELMREPAILFVDEPTSGLSSMDSEKIIHLLKKQTFKNKLVILTIHQPSSDIYKLFDKIIVIDQGGRLIYSGNPLDAISYFRKKANYVNPEESECPACGNVNSEQVLRIVEARWVDELGRLSRKRKRPPEEWEEIYKNERAVKKAIPKRKFELPKNNFNTPKLFGQFKIFLERNIVSKLGNRQYLLLLFFEAPILATILGLFTKHFNGPEDNPGKYVFSNNDNIPAFIFMSVIVALFLGMIISAEEIIRDKKILKREKFLHLSRWSYNDSKIFFLAIISAIQSFLFVIIGNYILQIKGLTPNYWLIIFSTSVCANLIGLNISSAANTVVAAYVSIPFILVPQLLLSGVVVDFNKIHKNITSVQYTPIYGDLMTSRWAYEALVVEQFKNNKFQKEFYKIDTKLSQNNYLLTFYIEKLKTIYANQVIASNTDTIENGNNYLELLKNELTKLSKKFNSVEFGRLANGVKEQFKDTAFQSAFYKELENLKSSLVITLRQYNKEREDKYKSVVQKLGDAEKFSKFQQDYFNQTIADLVQNNHTVKRIAIEENQILQLKDPIYRDPNSKFGRAHFYAPVKIIGKIRIDTYWFNLLIIWVMTGILYLLLQLDLLRKGAENFQVLKVTYGWSKKVLRM
jgi:ABC-type multidrug transport system ATPase subunit